MPLSGALFSTVLRPLSSSLIARLIVKSPDHKSDPRRVFVRRSSDGTGDARSDIEVRGEARGPGGSGAGPGGRGQSPGRGRAGGEAEKVVLYLKPLRLPARVRVRIRGNLRETERDRVAADVISRFTEPALDKQ